MMIATEFLKLFVILALIMLIHYNYRYMKTNLYVLRSLLYEIKRS